MRKQIALLIASLVLTGCRWDENADSTRRSANIIIASLEKFKSNNGEYPISLSELESNYLKKIPETSYGNVNNKFHYKRIVMTDSVKKHAYELWYYAPLGVTVKYESASGIWEHDD